MDDELKNTSRAATDDNDLANLENNYAESRENQLFEEQFLQSDDIELNEFLYYNCGKNQSSPIASFCQIEDELDFYKNDITNKDELSEINCDYKDNLVLKNQYSLHSHNSDPFETISQNPHEHASQKPEVDEDEIPTQEEDKPDEEDEQSTTHATTDDPVVIKVTREAQFEIINLYGGITYPLDNIEEEGTYCNCSKSKCIRFYCPCFRSGLPCADRCKCSSCGNVPGDRMCSSIRHDRLAHGLSYEPEAVECSCKGSFCNKAYCPCFKSGKGCSLSCKCLACKNKFGAKGGSRVSGNPNTNQK